MNRFALCDCAVVEGQGVYCVSCGTELPEDAEFCFRCGARQPTTTPDDTNAPQPDVKAKNSARRRTSSRLRCPQCRQLDSVQKVASVVDAHSTDSLYRSRHRQSATTIGVGGRKLFVGRSFGGGVGAMDGASQTRIAQKLAPPDEPDMQMVWGWGMLIGVPVIFYLVRVVLESLTNSVQLATNLAIAVVVLWLVSKVIEQTIRYHRYEQELPLWEAAMEQWERLYYCARCDGVFIPKQSALVPSELLLEFVYGDLDDEDSGEDEGSELIGAAVPAPPAEPETSRSR